MSDLKPCPFCQTPPAPSEVRGLCFWYVHCMECDADGPTGDSREAAIAAWNRRTPALGGSPSGGTVTLNNDPITVTVGDPVGYRRAPAKEEG